MKKASIAVMVLALALLLTPVFAGHSAAQVAPCAIVNGTIDGTESIQDGRIFRDGIPSTCANKAYPGILNEGTDYYYETYYYSNDTGADTCFTVSFNTGSCGVDVHASAYLNAYYPWIQSTNYLGDVGSSLTQPFDFTVPAGQNFVIVINTNNGLSTCSDYSFTVTAVDAASCSAAAPAPVPATNDYGMVVFAVLAALGSILVIRRKATV